MIFLDMLLKCHNFVEIYDMSKIRYQLPNSDKYIYITLDQYLDMDLAMLQDLIANDNGFDSDDPFDDRFDHYGDPKTWEVPLLEKEEEHIPEAEKIQIKKDVEDGE